MTKPIAHQRPGTSAWTALQVALGTALLTTLIAPGAARAAEANTDATTAVTPVAEPFSTEEWRHQQRTREPGQAFATEEWQLEQRRQLPDTGRVTRSWLQAQGAREQASANRPTLSGPALRRTHDRYLRTFEVDIPQQLRESLPSNK